MWFALCLSRNFGPVSLLWWWLRHGRAKCALGASASGAGTDCCSMLPLRLSPQARGHDLWPSVPLAPNAVSSSYPYEARQLRALSVLQSTSAASNITHVCSMRKVPTAFILPPLMSCTQVGSAGCHIIGSLVRRCNQHRFERMDPAAASMEQIAFMCMQWLSLSIPSLPCSASIFAWELNSVLECK